MLHSKSTRTNVLFLALLLCQIFGPYILAPFLQGMSYYVLLVAAQVLLQFPIVLYLVATNTNPFKLISFRLIHPGAAVLVILMTLCLIPTTMVINLLSMLFVENELTDLSQMLAQSQVGVNLLFVALMPALSEEFAFRGVFFHSMKKNGKWLAVLCSALFFGITHLNFNQFSYTFVIGGVMALAVMATGSIWGSVLVHFTFNGYSVVLLALTRLLDPGALEQVGQMEQAGEEILTTGNILLTAVIFGAVALIMLIPAGCFFYAIVHVCRQKAEVGPMFFPRKYEKAEHAERKEKGERKLVDIFFVLSLLLGFGYMLWAAFYGV